MSTVLITGTSTGLGQATALQLARSGHRVYATMRDLQRGEELQSTAQKEKLSLTLLALDVNDDASVRRAIDSVLANNNAIDILINNAGICPLAPIELATDESAKDVFDTNFLGALRTIRAVLPSMRARRAGTIVNVSSIGGVVAAACMGIYSASKFALEAMSESLAQEVFPHGIRVVLVEPGTVLTAIGQKMLDSISKDSTSPYATAQRRAHMAHSQAQQMGTDAQQVAQAIQAAIDDPARKFRYLVTADARALAGARKRITDEQWVSLGRHVADEDYFKEFATLFVQQ